MQHEIRLPKIDDDIAEVYVVQWLKAVGDRVSVDEPLLEVTSAKANIEILATAEGVLEIQCFAEEERVRVGDVVAVVTTDDPA